MEETKYSIDDLKTLIDAIGKGYSILDRYNDLKSKRDAKQAFNEARLQYKQYRGSWKPEKRREIMNEDLQEGLEKSLDDYIRINWNKGDEGTFSRNIAIIDYYTKKIFEKDANHDWFLPELNVLRGHLEAVFKLVHPEAKLEERLENWKKTFDRITERFNSP